MNLPNKLSTIRLCLVPVFVTAYLLPYTWATFVAAAVFILAAVTDFLDGYIARKYNMVTDLGKLLDPIADKVLVCSALFCVAVSNPLQFYYVAASVPAPWRVDVFGSVLLTVGSIIIISRELLISAVRQIAAAKGVVLQANIYGKVKTALQDVCLPVLILLNATTASQALMKCYRVGWWIAVVLFCLAVIMTVVSCIIYLVQNKKVFSD